MATIIRTRSIRSGSGRDCCPSSGRQAEGSREGTGEVRRLGEGRARAWGLYPKRSGWGLTGLFVVVALVSAACVGSAASGSASMKAATGAQAGGSPTAAALQTPGTSAEASATPAQDPLAIVPAAPAGTWKSVTWTALPAPVIDAGKPADGTTVQVFGWSRGYVRFAITPAKQLDENGERWSAPLVVSSSSADGVHWTKGAPLSVSRSTALMTFRSVIEGPRGLLAVGWTGGCASEYVDSLWTSTDGVSWSPVDVASQFGATSVARVGGGSAGFVAVAFHGEGTWTSLDGIAWHRVAKSGAAFGEASVDDGTSVGGHIVLAGTTGPSDCRSYVVSDQPPKTPLPTRAPTTASAWWSSDGATWTKAPLPGASPTSLAHSVWTARLGDRAAVLVDDLTAKDGSTTRHAWGSSDGRAWTPITLPADIRDWRMVSVGDRNLIVDPTADLPSAGFRLRTIDASFSVGAIEQLGARPALDFGDWAYGNVAIGPTGLVATSSDGSRTWFGQPSE